MRLRAALLILIAAIMVFFAIEKRKKAALIARIARAREHYAAGRTHEALIAYEALGGDLPNDATMETEYGNLLYLAGRRDEGDAQLQRALSSADNRQRVDISIAYRTHSEPDRARAIAADLFARAAGEERDAAALQLAMTATSAPLQEQWLRRIAEPDLFVVNQLRVIEARRAADELRFEDADQLAASPCAAWEASARADVGSAHNAASLYLERFIWTGKKAHLDKALELQRIAASFNASDGIVQSSLLVIEVYHALIRYLAEHVREEALGMQPDVAEILVEALAGRHGAPPEAEEALAVIQRVQQLAPRQPAAYERELALHRARRDPIAIERLLKSVHSARPFPRFEPPPPMSSEQRDQLRAAWKRELVLWTGRVERARPLGHAPSLAVALYVKARVQRQVAILERSPELLARSLEGYRESSSTWKISQAGMAHALLWSAVMAAETELAPELRAEWADRVERLGVDAALYELARDERFAKLMNAVRRHPDFTASLAARRGATEVSDEDAFLARFAEDRALLAQVKGGSKQLRLEAETMLLLYPGGPRQTLESELLRSLDASPAR